jgi:hypothetical protein
VRCETAGALHCVVHDVVQAQLLGRLDRTLARAREIDEIADEDREVLELCPDRCEDACALGGGHAVGALEQLDVGADRGQRRTQLVRGVADQLALRLARGLQGAEHRVEGGGQAPGLVIGDGLDAMVQLARGRDVLGGRGEPPERPRRRARHRDTEPRGQADTADRDREEDPAQPSERVLDIREGLATCTIER